MLAQATPEISFLGEEETGEEDSGQHGGCRPDRWHDQLRPGQSAVLDLAIACARRDSQCSGSIDAPLLGERFIARQGEGAYLNGTGDDRWSMCRSLGEAIIGVADFKVGVGSEEENRVHLAALARLARESLRVRMLGSAALDLAWLADGRLNATLMLSNLPWDVTAGLVASAGGRRGRVRLRWLARTARISRTRWRSVPSLVRAGQAIVVEAM